MKKFDDNTSFEPIPTPDKPKVEPPKPNAAPTPVAGGLGLPTHNLDPKVTDPDKRPINLPPEEYNPLVAPAAPKDSSK